MTTNRIPTILVEGTHGGAGATTVTSVLADLASQQFPTHVVDMSDVNDLDRIITSGAATYEFSEPLPRSPKEAAGQAVAERLGAVPDGMSIRFAITNTYHWDARCALEEWADLRVLVMDAAPRAADATARWIQSTPAMPTLVVVNALPRGNAGALGRLSIQRLRDQLDAHPPVLTIRRSVTISGTLKDQRPSIQRIAKHPMLDDYRAIWQWIQAYFAFPLPETRSAELAGAPLHH